MKYRLSGLLLVAGLSFNAWAAAPAAQHTALLKGLDHPWSLAFLPQKQGMLITLRGGELLYWKPGAQKSVAISGVPKVWAEGQGGLFDVVLAPDFETSRRVWLSFAEAGSDGKAGTAVGYGTLNPQLNQLQNFKVVFRQQPKLSTGNHFGARMVFDKQGHLFVALGENNQRSTAQDLGKLQGKVVRLTDQGEVAKDNPLAARSGANPAIWSYGHRNPQGLAINPWNQQLWVNEHGPKGGDEINRVEPGKNYGWPIATWGVNYSGLDIPEAKGGEAPGTEQPLFYWKVSPAVSGMAFYDSKTFPQWQNKLFIGALKEKAVIELAVDGDKVTEVGRLLTDVDARIRDVRVGPDGYLYVLTDESDGQLLKVSPAS